MLWPLSIMYYNMCLQYNFQQVNIMLQHFPKQDTEKGKGLLLNIFSESILSVQGVRALVNAHLFK